MTYHLQLLGNFRIEPPPEGPPIGKLNRKTRAILAYLAATGHSHTRQQLVDWFCQEAKDPAATLRWHLSQIRRKISPQLLETTRQTAVLKPNFSHCDHTQFEAAIDNRAEHSTEFLTNAVALYRGPFLQDIRLKNAPEFELWQLGERSRWQRLYEKGATHLVRRLVREEKNQDAIPVARAMLQHNPFLESVHAYLIWLYAKIGQRQAALEQFDQCKALLWDELAVAPTAALQTLQATIEQNRSLPPIWPAEASLGLSVKGKITDFIGREGPMTQLKTLWQNGRSIVLLDGPAGIGKTRLMQEFGQELPANVPRLTGSCYESTGLIPYQPWLSILETQHQLLETDQLARLPHYTRQHLGLLLPEMGETAVSPNQHQLFQAINQFLTELDTRACLILIEDLQWADEASLQLFQFLAQRLDRAARPIFLAATYRTEEAAENQALLTLLPDLERLPNFRRLALDSFDLNETTQLVANLRRDHSGLLRAPQKLEHLLQATGGNPLYLTEIMQELALGASPTVDLPVPPSLAALVARRLHHLPANGRQVIESLAILDQPAHFDLAQQISARSEEETLEAIEKGLHWRLLQTHQRYEIDFSHDLMRTAVLQQISPIRRQRLHRRAALALAQTNPEPATLAHHWSQAGNKGEESRYALLAAQKAAKLYANEEAIQFYRRAIPHLKKKETKLDAMRQLARHYQRVSDWENSRLLLEAGLDEAAPESAAAAHFQIILGQLYTRQSHYRRALVELEAATQICKKMGAADLLAHSVGTMGIVHYLGNAYDKSLTCFEEALAIAQELEDEENSAIWLSNIAAVFMDRGDHARALPTIRQAVAVHKRLDNLEQMAVGQGNLGNIYRDLGRFEEAVEEHIKVIQLRHSWGDRAGVATSFGDLGLDYAEVGLNAAAMSCFWQALTVDLDLRRRDACGMLLGHIGILLGRQGALSQAEAALETAVSLLRLTQSRFYLCKFLMEQANLFRTDSSWQQRESLLSEAAFLAQALDQTNLVFESQLLMMRLHAETGKLPLPQAIDQIAALPQDDEELAAAGYTIWQLDKTQEGWREKTTKSYRQLFSQAPLEIYRQRIALLTGEDLPLPELPEPPQLIEPLARKLSPYLQQVQSFLNS